MSGLPRGPKSQLLTLLRYARDPVGCMIPLAREYGDTFTFPAKPPLVCTGDPAGIKAIYGADPDIFEPLNQDLGVFIGERSLILLAGAEHKRGRKLMMPPFQGARMRAYGDQMIRITDERLSALQTGQTIAMVDFLQEVSLDVILQVVFGVTVRERMQSLAKLLLEITNGIPPVLALFPALRKEFGGMGPFARFLERKRRLHAALDELMAIRRAEGPREDILSLLLEARTEEGAPMPDAEIRDQLVLLVFAGHETTALTMAWTLYALHRPENASSLQRLRDELSALGPDPEPDKLAKHAYLEAVCDETMRRYPLAPAPNPRKLLRPFELLGYELSEGMAVAPAMGIAHFREDVYPEPLVFRPERFLERKFSPFEFLPFGGGTRRCLGAAMASYEMKLVLGTLLPRLRLRLASLKPDPGTVRAANSGPKNGVKMVVEERLA